MVFNPFEIDLPITEAIDSCREKLQNGNTLILHAPPGAGKSTLLPLALMNEKWLEGKKILMLEPRRLAAKTIAQRMADLLGSKLGKEIGYRIRFEQCISQNTQIEIITEGILSRMLQSDNALENVGLVIFDEFHERNLHADLALALCRQSQEVLRTDLRIMIMSATLNMPELVERLDAPLVSSEGKQYPIDIKYLDCRDPYLLPELCARACVQAYKEQTGDILAFLPGEGEIKSCEKILQGSKLNAVIHPLYGSLAPNKQFAAISADKQGRRKIVLATNIAETSLTIQGVKTVVDCGYSKIAKFDPRSGLSSLVTEEISKDSAEQRAGRAGRLGPGACYRLWSLADQKRMVAFRTPEILEADLSSLMLELAKWGNTTIDQLFWLNQPPKGHVKQALNTLELIGAIESNQITPHGELINKTPCHPRLAHLLIKAQEEELLELATDLAAVLEERDPLGKEAGIDINLRIEALRLHRKGQKRQKRFNRIEKVSASYRRIFQQGDPDNETFDPFDTGLLLVYAYPERIAHNRPGNNAQFKLANGKLAMASHQDDLAHESWLAIAQIQDREPIGKIFMASPLNPRDLAPMVKEKEVIQWDSQKGRIQTSIDLRIGNIILQSNPLIDPDPQQIQACILQAIQKEGHTLLNWTKEVEFLQNRIESIRIWHPSENWPAFSTTHLISKPAEWLSPYLINIEKAEELYKLDLKQILWNSLSYEKQERIAQIAPEKISVPSGSQIKIEYKANGSAPILAARIQEVFGLKETPKVNAGACPLIIHLLSPASRPIQITSDLAHFWSHTYFEVRKELRIKYAKHYWPENPLEAVAIRGIPKKNKPEKK